MQIAHTLDVDGVKHLLQMGEFPALLRAVRPYMEHCKEQIAKGETYPFVNDLPALEAILQKLMDSEEILSRYVSARNTG